LRAQQLKFKQSITVADIQRLGLWPIYTTVPTALKGPSPAVIQSASDVQSHARANGTDSVCGAAFACRLLIGPAVRALESLQVTERTELLA